jgi:hypothetical protein
MNQLNFKTLAFSLIHFSLVVVVTFLSHFFYHLTSLPYFCPLHLTPLFSHYSMAPPHPPHSNGLRPSLPLTTQHCPHHCPSLMHRRRHEDECESCQHAQLDNAMTHGNMEGCDLGGGMLFDKLGSWVDQVWKSHSHCGARRSDARKVRWGRSSVDKQRGSRI